MTSEIMFAMVHGGIKFRLFNRVMTAFESPSMTTFLSPMKWAVARANRVAKLSATRALHACDHKLYPTKILPLPLAMGTQWDQNIGYKISGGGVDIQCSTGTITRI